MIAKYKFNFLAASARAALGSDPAVRRPPAVPQRSSDRERPTVAASPVRGLTPDGSPRDRARGLTPPLGHRRFRTCRREPIPGV